jgi:long-chain acyl-CoA synthetase
MMPAPFSTPSLVQDFLEISVERHPEKVALVCDDQRLTYEDIERQANRLANALISNGVRRGDRVALFMPNSVELVTGIFATLKAGAVFVVVNHTTKQDKLAYILNNSQAVALVTWPARADLAAQLLESVSSLKFCVLTALPPNQAAAERILLYQDIQAQYSDQRPARKNIDLDLACLIYTSGSTGEPKGVMSDHSNVVFAAGSIITYLENQPDDVVINVLPLSFDYGLYQLLMTFRFGGRLVLEKGFTYPAQVLKRMEQEKVTGFPGVPTIFSVLLPMDLSVYDLSSLRYITNTAAALPVSHIQRIGEKFPQARMYSMYGLTETKRTLYLPPAELERRPGSVGIAIPGTEVWLEDENGIRLPNGKTGELVVRGRHVMRGYWCSPKATAERFRPSPIPGERLCYTGDLFRTDDEGFLYFVSRKDDIIKSRGEKVAPKEVEAVLYRLEGVHMAAVIGIPDPILGQAIKAFVVTDGRAMSEGEVLRHCRANLEDFMMPKQVEFLSEFPMTSSGKIKKTDLH